VDSDLDTDTTFQGDFLITSLNLGCAPGVAPAEDVITYDATFQGWADTVTVDIVNSGAPAPQWEESHIMPGDANISFAPDGTSDTWQLNLDDVATTGAVVLGSTTLMGCGGADGEGEFVDTYFDTNDDDEFLSIAVKISGTPDSDANEPDCAIFGYKAAETFAGDGCICFEAADKGNCENGL
jgi:hypothetical protein